MGKRLAIVGAGAKAAAIVARVASLRELGVPNLPEIEVFEREHIGAAWSGNAGFSNGLVTLCTPGEKDVGFPYQETSSRTTAYPPVGPHLFGRFSWSAYLVAKATFRNWVDRGREHPTHSSWAGYLTWVFGEANQGVTEAFVTKVEPAAGRWKVSFHAKAGGPSSASFDGVVLTGAGRAKSIALDPDIPDGRVLDADTFWSNHDAMRSGRDTTVTVVGDGGAAGAIIAWLVDHFAEGDRIIHSLSSMGTLFPRGDGYSERRWFSDPQDWQNLSVAHRRRLIERTEAGVVSLRNKATIDQSPHVQMHVGRAVGAHWNAGRSLATGDITVTTSYDGRRGPPIKTDFLVCAIGFEPWSMLELVSAKSLRKYLDPNDDRDVHRDSVEQAMTASLMMPPLTGLPDGLHVPGLAGLAQGPGMGNLGCLGLMAEAVLEPYL